MLRRCRNARKVGRARLDDYRFMINSEGYATIVPDEGHSVWGGRWWLTSEDETNLDYCEGVPANLYRKEMVVVDANGADEKVLVYLAANCQPGPPRVGYLELILVGARAFELPENYIAELSTHARRNR